MKDIVRRALEAEDNYNLLFIGSPACAKTLFLWNIRMQINETDLPSLRGVE
jgi:hypothetical protein